MLDQLLHEILWFGGGKMFIERNDQEMSHSKRAIQSDFVRRSGKQMRRFVRPQYFLRVRIKCDYDSRTVRRPSVLCRSRDHCLMAKMNTVEDADGEKEWTGQMCQFGNRAQDFHQ